MYGFGGVRDVMSRIIEQGAPGNSIMIMQGDKLLYENYQGLADIDSKIPIRPDTLFRIYSMTKVVVVACAMRYFERGELLLTDPVENYLPEFSGVKVHDHDWQGNLITREPKAQLLIKHLFAMNGGILSGGQASATGRCYMAGMKAAQDEHGDDYSIAHLVGAIAATPLAFDPGEHWRYGSSLEVLARVMGVISGKTLGEILADEIFIPLGMSDTSFKIAEDKKDRLCSMYRLGENKQPAPVTDMDGNYRPGTAIEHASGGLISSLGDYAKFCAALACGSYGGYKMLGKRSIELMGMNQLAPAALSDFRAAMSHYAGYGYGLGVRTMMDPALGGSPSSEGELGWYGMAGSWMLADPALGLSVTYMQQTLPAMQGFVQARLRNAIYAVIT